MLSLWGQRDIGARAPRAQIDYALIREEIQVREDLHRPARRISHLRALKDKISSFYIKLKVLVNTFQNSIFSSTSLLKI